MRQFINGSDEAFENLEDRAKFACVRFRHQELPPGCSPGQADIGFEIDSDSGKAKLLVSLGVRYSGQNSQVRQWLSSGQLEFVSFAELKNWIRVTLATEFQGATGNNNVGTANMENRLTEPTVITDMPVVQEAIRGIDKPLYLDEEQLFNKLSQRVRGQNEALKSLSTAIAHHLAHRHHKRPAVIFAIGPSGVGKTRTAESLSEVLRETDTDNTGYGFLRLDMTEYQEAHRVSQLIGAPQGYIGHNEGSQLVDALRANPRLIVLFDEIEKAHPAILRVLMNAMDAGRLSTASRSSGGHEVDCRLAVFIFTSNLDAKEILEELTNRNAFGNRAIEDEVCRRRLHAIGLAPEIVGRIGRFLIFRPLGAETRAEIVTLAVAEVAEEYGVKVSYVEPNIVIDLLKQVRSQNFGVRPERYIIDDILGGAFAKAAEEQMQNPVKVIGPPFQCVPAIDAEG